MPSFAQARAAGRCSTEEALALFDALAPLECAQLRGFWAGSGFPTGHPLDGMLEACGWAGKRFDADEDVQPLVFGRGARLFAVDPWLPAMALPLVLRWPALKSTGVAGIARTLLPLLATQRSRGRLRMVRQRGVVSATLVYDQAPIQDTFRAVGEGTVLGLMDCKGMEQPFFFVLQRDRP